MILLRYYLLPAFAGILFLLFTIYAYNRTQSSVNVRREKLFEIRTIEATNTIEHRIEEYTQILKGAQAFFAASDTVTRSSWREYYKIIDVSKKYPGIQGIGFAQHVNDDNVQAHIQAIKDEGYPEYTIRPAGERGHYYPVVFLEPMNERNMRAFGYDMYSESIRRKTMDRAAFTASPAITNKVTLVQETSTEVQPGFLLYLPLYNTGAASSTAAQHADLKGFIFAPFRMHDLMNTLLRQKFTDIDVEIYDDTLLSPASLLYDKDKVIGYGKMPDKDHLDKRATIQVANHAWTLCFTSHEEFGSHSDKHQPLIIFGSGTLISILLFFAIAGVSNTSRRANELADEMTENYRQSEERVRNIIRNAPDAVIVIDRSSRVLQWNPKAEKIFGYEAGEVLGGQLDKLIIPPRYREAHLKGMERYMSTGGGKIINRTVEITALTREGEEFPVEISISSGTFGKEPVFIAFIADIRERKKTEAELIRKTVDLERSRELERKKDEFLGVASHELKTPLTSAKAYIQLLERQLGEEQSSATARQYVQKANNYIDKLNRLIGDLLDATKIQSGKLQLETSEFALDPFVRECVESMQFVNSSHHIMLYGKTDLYIQGDKQRLDQVMVNLIANAIKYSPNTDTIDITMERAGAEVKIGVRDHGIGIAEANIAKIFSRFYRVEKDSSQYQGLGLGLYISKQIIERHKGRMWVESKPGEGSVFYFTLPIPY